MALDEVFIRICGVRHDLWRAVDETGVVLDILVQRRRNARTAKRFFRKLLKGHRQVGRERAWQELGWSGKCAG